MKVPEKLTRRRHVETRLGQVVFEKYLPMVEDLPVEDILDLRDKRASELDAFRAGLAELATQVDVTKTRDDQELDIHDLVAAKVDPAVMDLRAAMASSRLDALSKIGRSWKTIAGAVVPATLAFGMGAPVDVSAALGGNQAKSGTFLDHLRSR